MDEKCLTNDLQCALCGPILYNLFIQLQFVLYMIAVFSSILLAYDLCSIHQHNYNSNSFLEKKHIKKNLRLDRINNRGIK